MKKYDFILIFMVLIIFPARSQKQEKAIVDTYEKFKEAIISGDGSEAADYLDKRTIHYYEQLRKYALIADSLEVDTLPFMDKFSILYIRHIASKKDIESLDGKGVFMLAIKIGIIEKKKFSNTSLHMVKNLKLKAEGYLGEKETDMHFDFYKVKNRWKIDYVPVLNTSSIIMKALIASLGQQKENDYLLQVIEKQSGKKPRGTIWNRY